MGRFAAGYKRAPYAANRQYNAGFNPKYAVSRQGGVNYSQKQKPHSGCYLITNSAKTQKPVISAWKYTKRTGLFNIVAVPNNNDKCKNDKYRLWTAKVTMKMFPPVTVHAYYNTVTKCLTIPSMNLSMSHEKDYVAYVDPKKTRRR